MSDLFELAKITQDTYMSGSHQGQQYMLKKIRDFVEDNEDIAVSSRSFIVSFLNKKEKEIQELIDQTPVGKIMKKVENELF
jgi:hypothetical protein